ncbi:AbrB/MazE/SpoVT family DNA-binding domain-containing protein [Mesorhizobium sp. LHD-90]|uniref:antitoxin n=1 Tax=Mesorhizobium sp. LHD-90 TaxID=3071414 RepID=UPI0027DFF4DD|nr:AbrB/MazE/SpoVT family DNA-binding domain-containing protein [Mesorhizobium sp. LHD-90]MDQ6433654.1 AbrB/MazE/SpoVT family DNA-binding domain-containing protein [Mesorhizobium sp. LHD-90]
MEAAREKEASVFRNGRSQAVRIPKEFEFDTEKVLISRDEDGTVHLRPKPLKKSLVDVLDWLAQQPPFDEKMPEIEDFPPEPIDLDDKG